jgi:hypothetical protein
MFWNQNLKDNLQITLVLIISNKLSVTKQL